jgi:hypothetical protein
MPVLVNSSTVHNTYAERITNQSLKTSLVTSRTYLEKTIVQEGILKNIHSPLFYANLYCLFLALLPNLHHFLIYALTFSV